MDAWPNRSTVAEFRRTIENTLEKARKGAEEFFWFWSCEFWILFWAYSGFTGGLRIIEIPSPSGLCLCAVSGLLRAWCQNSASRLGVANGGERTVACWRLEDNQEHKVQGLVNNSCWTHFIIAQFYSLPILMPEFYILQLDTPVVSQIWTSLQKI